MEERKKSLSILLRNERKTYAKIDLYSALEWPDAPGSVPGLYRVQIDGKWQCFDGDKYSFMTIDAVMDFVELSAMSALGCSFSAQPKPDVSTGTPVKVKTGTMAGKPTYDLTRVSTPPIRGYDGRWYAGVIMIGSGSVMMPVDEMEVQG